MASMAVEAAREGPRPGPGQYPQGRRDQDRRPPPRRHEGPRDLNTVFIGNKPPMNYVLAVVTQFNSGSDTVNIRARGKAIAQAVDVAEIVRNKFFQKAQVKDVKIGTEVVTGEDGRKRHVSAIAIQLVNSEALPKPTPAPPVSSSAPTAPAAA